MCQENDKFSMDLLYFLPFQIFGCRFPGFNIHTIGPARLEVSSLWEVICDSKEGQMGKNLRRKHDGKIDVAVSEF